MSDASRDSKASTTTGGDPRETSSPSAARAQPPSEDRRDFLARASKVAMATGLAAGYGALGVVAARYLYPAGSTDEGWVFAAETAKMRPGDSRLFRGPSGETINITRTAAEESAESFIALSSTCPHLGCQVHWEPQNDRYFCPCHNGTFDAEGKGTGGPPGDAGQTLPKYPLRVEKGLLFVSVPSSQLARGERLVEIERRRRRS